jgi:hypothetical protein
MYSARSSNIHEWENESRENGLYYVYPKKTVLSEIEKFVTFKKWFRIVAS